MGGALHGMKRSIKKVFNSGLPPASNEMERKVQKALRLGDCQLVRRLWGSGEDLIHPDDKGYTSPWYAIAYDSVEMLQTLYDCKVRDTLAYHELSTG